MGGPVALRVRYSIGMLVIEIPLGTLALCSVLLSWCWKKAFRLYLLYFLRCGGRDVNRVFFSKVSVCDPKNFGMASPIFISKHLLKKEVHPFRDGASGIGIVGSWSHNLFLFFK